MLHKLIIVYNPRSSHYAQVREEVLRPAQRLKGWLVGKYELRATDVDDNAKRLAKIISDGDLVVAAGGDGTATVAINGVMRSEKDATFSALGYGNFNDAARMLGTKRPVEYGGEYLGGILDIVQAYEAGKTEEMSVLEAKVNREHWRYALCYVTAGMMAESTQVLNQRAVRKELKTGKKSVIFSIWQLAKWYFREHRRSFLPIGEKSGPEIIISGEKA